MTGELPIIEEALEEILGDLRAKATCPLVREQRALASKYQRVVSQWSHTAPSAAQAAAMLECVMDLHVGVRGRSTARPPPGWDPDENDDTRSTIPPPPSKK